MARKRLRIGAFLVSAAWLVCPYDGFSPRLLEKREVSCKKSFVLKAAPNDNDDDILSTTNTDDKPTNSSFIVAKKNDFHTMKNTAEPTESYSMAKKESNKSPSLPGAQWIDQLISAPLVEVSIAYLVICSSVLVAIGTLSLNPSWQATIEDWQNVIAYTFCIEFVARWYASDKSVLGYLSQPLVLVDVVVVILPVVLPLLSGAPPWLTSKTGLTNLRLLRILRLQRVLQDLQTFSAFTSALGFSQNIKIESYQLQLARVFTSLFTLLSVSAGLIYAAEHGVNPDMKNYFSALYFGLTTLTTVGFGDITPVTSQGKLVVSGSILAGVTVIPAQTAALVESLMKKDRNVTNDAPNQDEPIKKVDMNDMNKLPSSAVDAVTPCPFCGATFHWTSAKYCWSCGSRLER